jgi:hypothetical protein
MGQVPQESQLVIGIVPQGLSHAQRQMTQVEVVESDLCSTQIVMDVIDRNRGELTEAEWIHLPCLCCPVRRSYMPSMAA